MATNLLRVGVERQVNLAPNDNVNQLASDAAVMSNGRFFVVYEDDGGAATDVAGQFIGADGTLAEHSFGDTGPASSTGNQTAPATTSRLNGGALVAWTDEPTSD